MTTASLKIIGISGSLRMDSSNTNVLRALGTCLPAGTSFGMYEGIGHLPHFNPELDKEGSIPAESVKAFRGLLKDADGLVICSPEYAAGVPGVLKNALDWIVSSGELVNKPVAAISASPAHSGGQIALASLVGTLRIMTAITPDELTLSIPFISKKLQKDVPDEETAQQLKNLAGALVARIGQLKT